ncbi:hypothetical protein [Bradymonas sediminis]|uniref:Uncharacterized protein n=1 Tax=Bradymonas sediminis TaxID=1548548 RepID=A0A2Z4FLP6_9DELT|nr:hypothetical protein [Bradymonas sediminis]AWV89750.1 hypothetical protein DN745_10535 [Bradymonas sediminis]TDP76503.1 hypothetical protein DFR33_102134 [Bradymonas sediminis]
MSKRRYFRAQLLGVSLLAFAAVSCTDQGPRELAQPIFDARAPFEELSASGTGATGAKRSGQSAGGSEFEKAIAESMAGGDDAEQDPADDGAAAQDAQASEAVQTQKVVLPGGLASTVPLDFDTWKWTSENGVTLITHRAPGGTSPDAVIYAERFSNLVRVYPSQEMERFRKFADPGFTSLLDLLNPESPALPQAALEQLDPAQLRELGIDPAQLTGSATPASNEPAKLVQTLNYRSSSDTFSGWKWFGKNDADVILRLGRTQGRWKAPQLRGEQEVNEGESSAWMLLGSANLGGNMGTHIAIICKQAPRCSVASELSEFLAKLAPADASTLSVVGGESTTNR